jgi:hypothetical protein
MRSASGSEKARAASLRWSSSSLSTSFNTVLVPTSRVRANRGERFNEEGGDNHGDQLR